MQGPWHARPRGLTLALALLLAGGVASAHTARPSSLQPAAAIRYYRRQVERDPRHYPSWSGLGAAYLAEAQRTHEPGSILEAEHALDRSLALQPSFDALKGKAALANFRHRFDDAVRWGLEAHAALPADPEAVALLVEAYLGLGEPDRAAALLSETADRTASFHRSAARGHWLRATGRLQDAAAALLEAGELAAREGAPELARWAQVAAAGALLDDGRCAAAREILARAASLAGGERERDRFLRMHEGELADCEGRLADALAIAEQLIAEHDDPELRRRAFLLAAERGETARARRHFEAARRGFEKAVHAGEGYTLEGLARLYLDSGVETARALELATWNYETKRDPAAAEVLACARERLPPPG